MHWVVCYLRVSGFKKSADPACGRFRVYVMEKCRVGAAEREFYGFLWVSIPHSGVWAVSSLRHGEVPSRRCREGVLWLPLGFHPTLHRTLCNAVAELTKNVQWQQLYSMAFGVSCPCVRLSWYNALRSQAFVIKQLGRRQG